MKALLFASAILVAGMIPAMAQSNPSSPDAVDTEMQLAWPDGTAYINELNLEDTEIVTDPLEPFTYYVYVNWRETAGGGRWPELVDVPLSYPSFGTSIFYGSYHFVSSDDELTVQKNDQGQVAMITGGGAGVTGSEFYMLLASAQEYYMVEEYPGQYWSAYWASSPISPEQIQVGSLGHLTTAGTNNGVPYGTLWVVLPLHTEVPVTPHAGAAYNQAYVNVQPYQLLSQCQATIPANRARTTIGVGEQVDLNFNPALMIPSPNIVWSTTAGSLSSIQGSSTVFTAPSNAATATVTVKVYGKPMSINYKVVEPSGVIMVTNGFAHTVNRPNIGMHTAVYLKPDSVNFGRVWCQEEQAYAVAKGVYAPLNGFPHETGPHPVSFSSTVVPGLGTLIAGAPSIGDNIYSGDPNTLPPFAPGTETLTIPWDFRVGAGGTWKTNFVTLTQSCALGDGGVLTTSKAGASWSCNVSDATITYPYPGAPF